MDKYEYIENPFFTKKKLSCTHSGKYYFSQKFLKQIISLRKEVDEPLVCTSGYRCPEHPNEIGKKKGGAHTQGRAIDLKCARQKAYKVIKAATKRGLRIGVSQKGNARFIHIDDMGTRDGDPKRFLPATVWSY